MFRLLFISFFLFCRLLPAEMTSAALAAGGKGYALHTPETRSSAGDVHGKVYTVNEPLIYEDMFERYPYSFLGYDGVPRGFNIELMKVMLRRLQIPYEIRMRRLEVVHDDMRNGRCDVSLGAVSAYNKASGILGKETICELGNSMLVLKKYGLKKLTVDQLRGRKMVVRTGSRPHTYLLEHGIPDSMFTIVPEMDMESEILREASLGTDGVIWNSMMMERMLRKYRLDDRYVAVPIDMPQGEYRFLSKDTVLLARLDSLCAVMKKNGEISQMLDKWLYLDDPESSSSEFSNVLPMMCVFVVVSIVLFCLIRYFKHNVQNRKLAEARTLMRLTLHSNKIKVWMYFPEARAYAWMTNDGRVNKFYSPFDFSRFFPDGNFSVLHRHVMNALAGKEDIPQETMRCYSVTEKDKVLDVEVMIRRLLDDYDKVYLICGLQTDITESKAMLSGMKLMGECYHTAFMMARGTVMRFDATGRLVNFNEMGLYRMGIDNPEKFYAEGYSIYDVDLLEDVDIDNCPNDLRLTHITRNGDLKNVNYFNSKYCNPKPFTLPGYTTFDGVPRPGVEVSPEGYYDLHFIKTVNNKGKIISYMLFVNDKTDEVRAIMQQREKRRRLKEIEECKQLLLRRRDYMLKETGVRMVSYNPSRKELAIFENESKVVSPYSQVGLLEIIDPGDVKKVCSTLLQLDALCRDDITLEVKTQRLNDCGEMRHFRLNMRPSFDADDKVMFYYGTCHDITESVYTHKKLLEETKIVRDTELVKSGFLKNTSYSLRQPLVVIQRSIHSLGEGVTEEQQQELVGSITGNTRRLIALSDDTLLLSRIEAGLLTVRREPMDFVQLFLTTVNDTLDQYPSSTVTRTIENTYEHLLLKFDATLLQRILHEAVALSARYTTIGNITVRYMYIKDKLSIAIQDNGQGIPPNVAQRLFESHIGDEYTLQERGAHVSGLEMPICKALVDMFGGHIDVETNPGRGTSIYITLNIERAEDAGTADDSQAQQGPEYDNSAELKTNVV